MQVIHKTHKTIKHGKRLFKLVPLNDYYKVRFRIKSMIFSRSVMQEDLRIQRDRSRALKFYYRAQINKGLKTIKIILERLEK